MIVEPGEVILLALGLAALGLAVYRRKLIAGFPHISLMKWSYLALLAGWVLTILEGFFMKNTLNTLEHGCYAASTVLLAVWSARVFAERGTGKS